VTVVGGATILSVEGIVTPTEDPDCPNVAATTLRARQLCARKLSRFVEPCLGFRLEDSRHVRARRRGTPLSMAMPSVETIWRRRRMPATVSRPGRSLGERDRSFLAPA